jgi:signal transduction histidine kinase
MPAAAALSYRSAVDVTTLRERLRRVPAPVVDALLAVAVAGVTAAAVRVAVEPRSNPPDAFAYVLAVAFGAVLLPRRRWPLGVFAVSNLLLFAYYTIGYPGITPAIPLGVALYTAAAAGHLRWCLASTAFYMTAGAVVLGVRKHVPALEVLTSFLPQASLMVALSLLGDAVRSRRGWQAEVRERLARVEADREAEARRRVERERLRIARELHDVLAHTISVVTVQAGVAADVLQENPGQARAALAAIRSASREAMAELKATVGVLRGGERDGEGAPRPPSPGLGQLAGLLELAREGGLRVESAVAGEPRPLPALVDLTAYRIVQESLTNVGRHAGAATATVTVRYEPGAVVVQVDDDGRGPAPELVDGQPGYGLVGMAERSAALGGRLDAGPRPGGGFRVRAWLPAAGRAS